LHRAQRFYFEKSDLKASVYRVFGSGSNLHLRSFLIKIIMKNCKHCLHLYEESDGPSPEGRYFWWEYGKTSYHNLKSFPFKNTKCKHFKDYGKEKRSRNIEFRNLLNEI